MAKINQEQFTALDNLAREFMGNGANWADGKPKSVEQVVTGSQAWEIAHRAGITEFCYGNTSKDIEGIPDIHDAHIVTALKRIFPNAIFKDRYRY